MGEHLRDSLFGSVQGPDLPCSFGFLYVAFVDEDAEGEGSQNELHHNACEAYELAGLNRIVHSYNINSS
jgi:hypothetical protein